MASKANVIFNVVLLSVVISVGNVIRLKVNPFDREIKRALGYHNDSLLNFTELSGQYGFASEEHTVTTEDGYILTIFRIKSKRCQQFKSPPVILMHGLIQSSDGWLNAGPNAGLAYLIADACYDLWVGNQRGNYYSRKHIHLDPDRDSKFWQFSVDEIGLYDIPATIDYVLRNTGEEKLNYIGFSQGAGTFFIMCSERPGYCDKANVLIALAPATRHTHSKSVMFRKICESVRKLEGVLTLTGVHELFSKGAFVQELLAFLCKFRATSEMICGTVVGVLDSFHPGSISAETLQVMIGYVPAGTSTHNMARYGQSMRTEKFQKFDYGRGRNLGIYGTEQPPSYNLTAVTVPCVTFYGRNDYIVDPKDVFWLVNQLPNVLGTEEIADPLWNHFDMTYSQYVNKMLFPKVHQYLQKYSRS
ncbi:lipase 1-like [Maniola hyperantus]|uniref:lipase 1-like n=1 Tax=Aphantopus hyperantus TaxID=2795564 RepID=UPI00156862D5|nr:lipase 1-like [Maniola hyperantus]